MTLDEDQGGCVTVPSEMGFPDGAAVLNLDVAWIHGSEAAKYNSDPDIQVHACDEYTYILRQNKAVSYEAPFMFLLFGASRVGG
jgi:hydroxyacylglutathione hydrolase